MSHHRTTSPSRGREASANRVDQDLARAEVDASPLRFPDAYVPPQRRQSGESSSGSSSSSSASTRSRQLEEINGMSRIGSGMTRTRTNLELERTATTRSQHSGTVGRSPTSRLEKGPLPAFGGGKPFPPELPKQEEYVVEFDGQDDPLHGQNWSLKRKLFVSIILAYHTFTSAWGSSVFSPTTIIIARIFGVSSEVTLLGTSLYVLGFAFGPILWAPYSELKGRKQPLVLSAFGAAVFHLAVAVGKDLQTVLICRFFAGFFAACPLTVVAAVFADIFDNKSRGMAVTIFAMTVFGGPLVAPIAGGFIVLNKNLDWRWTEYITAIMTFVAFGLDFLFLKETYPPVILVQKAAVLRRRTLNWGIHAKQEEIEVDFKELMQKNFTRPLRLLFTEPIILLISIYMSFIYGLLYLFLTAYPRVFQTGAHHFNAGVGALPFLGIVVGYFLAGASIIGGQGWYVRKLEANNNRPVPEWRLPQAIAGAVSFAVGLFWFGWTGYTSSIHWIVPTLSGLATGFGILTIFLQLLNYIIDAYLMFAASALAGNAFLRSLAGAVFPLFSMYMFDALHVNYTLTLLGAVAAVMAPIPLIFYVYGKKIRARSKFAPTSPAEAKKLMAVEQGEEELDSNEKGEKAV